MIILAITGAIILILIVAAIITVVTTKYITEKIYIPMRYKTMNLTTDEMFNELTLIIQNEISLYEKSVFENGGKFLDNRTFENYYRDICNKIGEDIPPEFYTKFAYYMAPEAVNKFIARTVRLYLEQKIAD